MAISCFFRKGLSDKREPIKQNAAHLAEVATEKQRQLKRQKVAAPVASNSDNSFAFDLSVDEELGDTCTDEESSDTSTDEEECD